MGRRSEVTAAGRVARAECGVSGYRLHRRGELQSGSHGPRASTSKRRLGLSQREARYSWSVHYLGPGRPLTSLSTWDEVVDAANGGLLEENQWCELKAMLPPSSKGTNLELARDLASLSVFGGALIIGVADKTLDVVGVDDDVEGLKSRISQVAGMTITPPLSPVSPPDSRAGGQSGFGRIGTAVAGRPAYGRWLLLGSVERW